MTTTNFLGLTTYDTASGSATSFQTFRLAVSGITSNMSLIDNWANAASGSISSIKSNSVMNVNASYISTNYYEATNSSITTYATNMLINLKLNISITGATIININSFGNSTLKKINSGGASVDLISGDLIANRYYLFVYNGTNFILIGPSSTEQYAHGCSVYSSSPLNISGCTLLTFDSENYDTDGFHSGSENSGRLIVPSGYAGYYHITFNGEWGTSGSGYYFGQIDQNNMGVNTRITDSGTLFSTGSFTNKKFNMSGDMYISSGCHVSIYVGQNTSASTVSLQYAKFMLDYRGQ